MRVLYLTHRLPYAPNRGDRIRAFHMLEAMARFADVSLFSFVHDDEEQAQAGTVPFAESVTVSRVHRVRNLIRSALALPGSTPLTHAMLDAHDVNQKLCGLVRQRPPDVVVAYCSGMARLALEPPLNGLPFVLDMVDVDSAKWQRLGASHSNPRGWIYRREASVLRDFEVQAATRARATLLVNERERDLLHEIAPTAQLAVIPNGIDADRLHPPNGAGPSASVVFCGVLDYAPNEAGVLWFARDVWPRVRMARPDARFVIVGSRPTHAIRSLASSTANIDVTGSVPEVQPYLWRAAVSVAPLHMAQGVQNKVLEALAAGLPVVTTSVVAAGLPSSVLPGCDIADDAATFAEAVTGALAASPEARRQRAASARVGELRWSRRLADLEPLIQAAGGRPT
jgi:sugar transferase (PEP-CTERM/EpsH1 system associated)